MPRIITVDNKNISVDEDGHLTSDFLHEKHWVGVPFTNHQELFLLGNKPNANESGVVSTFSNQFQNIGKLKAIMLDDGQYNDTDIPNEASSLSSFIGDNFIFNFLITDKSFSWAYIHDNYYDAFILYSTPDSFQNVFGSDYKVLQQKYLGFWNHPDSEPDEIETARYIHSKYA